MCHHFYYWEATVNKLTWALYMDHWPSLFSREGWMWAKFFLVFIYFWYMGKNPISLLDTASNPKQARWHHLVCFGNQSQQRICFNVFFSIFWANIGRSRNLAYDIELCFVSLKFVMIVQSYISLMLSQKGKENQNTDYIWILHAISKPVHVIGKNCEDIAVVYWYWPWKEHSNWTRHEEVVMTFAVLMNSKSLVSLFLAIWFRYDLSPITVKYVERRKPLYHFITTVWFME